jgi:hypothetical protein
MSAYPKGKEPTCPTCGINKYRDRSATQCQRCALTPGWQTEDEAAIPKGLPFEREWITWLDIIGAAKDRYAGPARQKAQNGRLKVVAFGDTHVPFHAKDAIAEMLVREKEADVAVIGGDFTDSYSFSTFTKYEHVSFHEEFAAATLLMQQFSETWPRVLYLRGSNHKDRFEKRLRESLDKDMIDAILTMTGGILEPDLVLVKRFPNVEVANVQTPNGDAVNWLCMLGDVAFSHAEKYSRVPGAALRSVEEWLSDYRGKLGLPPIRCLVQFHTHTANWFPWRADMLLVEAGCLCETHKYQLGSKIAGRPQRTGYVTFELVDGKVDLNSVRPRILDWAH